MILTRVGEETVRLVPVRPQPSANARRAVVDAVQAAVKKKGTKGATAARSQDFLYGDGGLPE